MELSQLDKKNLKKVSLAFDDANYATSLNWILIDNHCVVC